MALHPTTRDAAFATTFPRAHWIRNSEGPSASDFPMYSSHHFQVTSNVRGKQETISPRRIVYFGTSFGAFSLDDQQEVAPINEIGIYGSARDRDCYYFSSPCMSNLDPAVRELVTQPPDNTEVEPGYVVDPRLLAAIGLYQFVHTTAAGRTETAYLNQVVQRAYAKAKAEQEAALQAAFADMRRTFGGKF